MEADQEFFLIPYSTTKCERRGAATATHSKAVPERFMELDGRSPFSGPDNFFYEFTTSEY
jgi:hypothetical protein